MMSEPRPPRERAINVPTAILVASALLVAIHLVRTWLDDETGITLLIRGAFTPAPWSVALGLASPDDVLAAAQAGVDDAETRELRAALASYVLGEPLQPFAWLTYGALHASWTHVGLNVIWLVAFGTPVVRRAGPARTLAVALAASAAGALAAWIAEPLGIRPIVGASAAVSGLMAAAATFVFERPGWHEAPAGRWSFLRSRGALGFLAAWFAGNLLFGVLPVGIAEGAVAWQAHIGGLLAGLLLFPAIDPGRRGLPA